MQRSSFGDITLTGNASKILALFDLMNKLELQVNTPYSVITHLCFSFIENYGSI